MSTWKDEVFAVLGISVLLTVVFSASAEEYPRGERAIDIAFCMFHSEEILYPQTNEEWRNMGEGCWRAVDKRGPEWSQVWRDSMESAGVNLEGLPNAIED